MEKYIKPSIKVRMIGAETILAGSDLVIPIGGDDDPATGPANGKGALFPEEETYEVESKSLWDD